MDRTRNGSRREWIALGILGMALAAGGVGCGGGDDCGTGNCAGCCVAGICVAGTEPGECGTGGLACQVCIAGLDCQGGTCVPSTTSCGPGNCPDGCCDGNLCRSGRDSFACGTGGDSCTVCEGSQACLNGGCSEVGALCASSCDGCCVGNQCMAGTTPDACGRGGQACRTCRTEEFCNGSGQCQCTPSCAGRHCGDDDGCGGTCQDAPCQAPGFVCQQGRCEVDPAGFWQVSVIRADIASSGPDGDYWDAAGGLPDPFVCVSLGGVRKCTSTKQETLGPVWRESLHRAAASSLMGDFRYEIVDEDLSSNDLICASSSVRAIREDFVRGSLTIGCAYATVELALEPPEGPEETCTASASSVHDGCLRFRQALCNRLMECAMFASPVECGTWFDSENGFGGCNPDDVRPIGSPARFQECICGLSEASCEGLRIGILTAIPPCGEWVS